MTSIHASLAVNTYPYTLTHTALDCARSLAKLGFGGLELMLYPGHLWPADCDAGQRRMLKRELDAMGLRVLTLNMPNIDVNIAAAVPEMRAHSLNVLRGAMELAGDLGAGGVIVGPGKANPLLPMQEAQLQGHFFRALDELVPVAERAGTAIYSENMPFAFLPRVQQLLAALDLYGDARIGLVFDVANSHFIGEPVAQALSRCGPRLRLVHLSDTDRQRYAHAPVGAGTLDFGAVAQALHELPARPQDVLEIVCDDPDEELPRSAAALAALGWPGAPR